MSAPARESVYQAIFALAAAIPGLVTASRKIRHWADVAPAEQPALFQVQKLESIEPVPGLPPKHRFAVDLYLYANSSDPGIAPSSILNPLIDALEAALAPDLVDGRQTLGGLVEHAWISPRIETDEGVLGDQTVVIVPVEILVP